MLTNLNQIIKKRKQEMPDGSYTTELFKQGENKIIKKLGEEFAELIMSAVKKDKAGFVNESVDFVYHYLVLLNYLDIDLDLVQEELKRRSQ